MKRRVVFESSAFEDFNHWAIADKKIYKKIVLLIKDVERSPFTGGVTHAQEKYLRQIQADSTAFNSALKPLGNFIQTIQGITDIERTQNERVLNQTVAIAGVGVSMASLTASSLSGQADKIIQAWRPVPANQPPSVTNLWISAALILLVSIAIGSLAALMTAKLVNRKTAQP